MTGSLQVKNKKFYIVINTYENGKRKQKWINTELPEKGNKRKAEKLLVEVLHQYESLSFTKVEKAAVSILFVDYIKHWLTCIEKRVDTVTMQGYTLLTNRHIIPYFTPLGLKLSQIKRGVLQDFIDEKWKNGRLDGKGGLSPKSVKELKNLVNQVLNLAIQEDLIDGNPCSTLILPATKRPAAKFYSISQLNALLESAKDEPLYPLLRTAVVYGLRRSELLGLKWDSIDFENETLHVIHTVVKVSTVVEKDKTKSKSSRRSFPLLPEMHEMFLDIKRQQKENSKLLGKGYYNSDYIFCWPDGHPFSPDYVSKHFSLILKKNGFPHIRFHELRHSCASLLINQGQSLKDVQEWLGHSDIGVTADIYGHLDTQRKLNTASLMSKCIYE